MPGGKNRINEHPKANTNGFAERPGDAGKPKGRKDNITIVREILEAKGIKNADPNYFILEILIDIIKDPETPRGIRERASRGLFEILNGRSKINQEMAENEIRPIIILKDQHAIDNLEKMKYM